MSKEKAMPLCPVHGTPTVCPRCIASKGGKKTAANNPGKARTWGKKGSVKRWGKKNSKV